jgi:hypothetical protein
MGSHILGSRKKCSFFGIVPGSFQKVPEDSGGVRKSMWVYHVPMAGMSSGEAPWPYWARRTKSSKAHMAREGKKGRSPSRNRIGLGVQVHVCTIHGYCSRDTIPSTPSPYTYINRVEGAPQKDTTTSVSRVRRPLHRLHPRSYSRGA